MVTEEGIEPSTCRLRRSVDFPHVLLGYVILEDVVEEVGLEPTSSENRPGFTTPWTFREFLPTGRLISR